MELIIKNTPVYNSIPIWEVDLIDSESYSDTVIRAIELQGAVFENGRKRLAIDSNSSDFSNIALFNPKYILELISKALNEDSTFSKLYPSYKKDIYNNSAYNFLKQNIGVIYFGVKDSPGYKMEPHHDNRGIFGNIIINLKDNIDSTVFYNYQRIGNLENSSYIGSNEADKGVFFLNSENTLHSVTNSSQTDRYVLNIALVINSLI